MRMNPFPSLKTLIVVGVAIGAILYSITVMQFERTLVIIKPDGVARGVTDAVYSLYREAGITLIREVRIENACVDQLAAHYVEHIGRPFYPALIEFMSSGVIIVSEWSGRDAIGTIRRINGPTDPTKAAPDTVRGKFGSTTTRNVVHASDSSESAIREVTVWFR